MGSLTVKSGHRISQPTTPPGQKGVPSGGRGEEVQAGKLEWVLNISITARWQGEPEEESGARCQTLWEQQREVTGLRQCYMRKCLRTSASTQITARRTLRGRQARTRDTLITKKPEGRKPLTAPGEKYISFHSRRQHGESSAENTEVIPFFMNIYEE